jgi:hypothetical protein
VSIADDISSLPREQLRALAEHPGTDGELLARLARLPGIDLLPSIVANPSTPAGVRAMILRDFPHLREYWTPPASAPGPGPVTTEADRAIEQFRQRSAQAARNARVGTPASWAPAAPSYIQAVDDSGRAVLIPSAYLTQRRTNGLAIAAFVLSLLGAAPLAVIFGHVAKRQIWERDEDGEGLATAGLVIGYLGIALFVVVILIGVVGS